MATTRAQRRLICSVRTHCGGQEARLYQLEGVKSDTPLFRWEAGTITPSYDPKSIGEDDLVAEDAGKAVEAFRKMLMSEKVIPSQAHTRGYVSPLLVQHYPKPSEADVCAMLQPVGNARLVRAMQLAVVTPQPEEAFA